jgi:hypothetical protein
VRSAQSSPVGSYPQHRKDPPLEEQGVSVLSAQNFFLPIEHDALWCTTRGLQDGELCLGWDVDRLAGPVLQPEDPEVPQVRLVVLQALTDDLVCLGDALGALSFLVRP